MRALGVVVPAHDEQVLLGPCLDALAVAAQRVAVPVHVLVVLDDCADDSLLVCRARGVPALSVRERNAGRARGAGFDALVASCDWIASTDADSTVGASWLSEQLRLAGEGAAAVFGVVDVVDWSEHPTQVRDRFRAQYTTPEPHPHRHGACFGVSTTAYLQVGGMPPLAVGEDRALARQLERVSSLSVVASTSVRVTTSARRTSRVEGGFATSLGSLA